MVAHSPYVVGRCAGCNLNKRLYWPTGDQLFCSMTCAAYTALRMTDDVVDGEVFRLTDEMLQRERASNALLRRVVMNTRCFRCGWPYAIVDRSGGPTCDLCREAQAALTKAEGESVVGELKN